MAGSAESKEWNKINEINLIEFLRPAGASNWFGLGWLNCCGLWAAAQPMLRNNESKLNTKPKGRNEWNGTASRGRKLCFSLRAAVKWSEMEQRGPEASTQPSLHSIKIKLSILFFFHSVKLALLKGIKIYYNSKYIDAEETDVSRNQTSTWLIDDWRLLMKQRYSGEIQIN